ncbi:MAG TPA: glycerophosphodiester phosphodiesterase [Acidiferrobacteraceae bacterium]|nr:glycerophosphodiester phosphodiesterase [Acidiferrobacteraceae bacterium]
MNIPTLIAHRGFTLRYPENTLLSIEAAAKAGACYVEFDIQLTQDKAPIVFHDVSLKRTTGKTGKIFDMPWDQLKKISANEASRLGASEHPTLIPSLAQVIERLKAWPELFAFVEIKEESVDHFGMDVVLDAVMATIQPLLDRCIVISFSDKVIPAARDRGAHSTGWVIPKWKAQALALADEMKPDFLFCNYKKVPDKVHTLPQGPWKWALYEIADPQLALDWAARGADLIETYAIGDMLQHPVLQQRACSHD